MHATAIWRVSWRFWAHKLNVLPRYVHDPCRTVARALHSDSPDGGWTNWQVDQFPSTWDLDLASNHGLRDFSAKLIKVACFSCCFHFPAISSKRKIPRNWFVRHFSKNTSCKNSKVMLVVLAISALRLSLRAWLIAPLTLRCKDSQVMLDVWKPLERGFHDDVFAGFQTTKANHHLKLGWSLQSKILDWKNIKSICGTFPLGDLHLMTKWWGENTEVHTMAFLPDHFEVYRRG